ncbi:HEPN domain-containing protein [Thioalkalivibrio sp. ALE23]|uniref:HEPN domain-containing protein n=1 Tax=Thioalkalivibrio sp. ALE23 TaxID=1265495 RepID=UPI000376DF10|nr:HEPN domain-containing protein [Thioalkalivibrio sp. ALE23]
MSHDQLKARQRAERHEHAEGIALRIHRALSWLKRSEMCDDEDGRFIFLWIAFNAAYANDLGEQRVGESRLLREFLHRLSDLDGGRRLYDLVWRQYSESIRLLLNNQYVFQTYWDCQNRVEGSEDWQERFAAARRAAHAALAQQDTGTVLAIVFQRLYTLRNQLVHGGATWGSSVNREQLRDANRIMGDLVPAVIEIMLDNAQEHWGDACYPVH